MSYACGSGAGVAAPGARGCKAMPAGKAVSDKTAGKTGDETASPLPVPLFASIKALTASSVGASLRKGPASVATRVACPTWSK